MPRDIAKTLRRALTTLEAERTRLESQIEAVRGALGAVGGRARATRKPTLGARARRAGSAAASSRSRRRRKMSPAERKAVSERMKAFWAGQRAKETRGRAKARS